MIKDFVDSNLSHILEKISDYHGWYRIIGTDYYFSSFFICFYVVETNKTSPLNLEEILTLKEVPQEIKEIVIFNLEAFKKIFDLKVNN